MALVRMFLWSAARRLVVDPRVRHTATNVFHRIKPRVIEQARVIRSIRVSEPDVPVTRKLGRSLGRFIRQVRDEA